MSSCAAFSSTCCRAALCASATSAFSPIGDGPSFCHYVSDCCGQSRPQRQPLHPWHAHYIRTGTVLSVAEPCRLWNDSPPLNSFSDPPLTPSGAQHETTSPASNRQRATAPTVVVSLLHLRISSAPPLHTLPDTTRQLSLRRSPVASTPRLHQNRATKNRSGLQIP